MDTRFLIFMKPRLRVAALARPVGANTSNQFGSFVIRPMSLMCPISPIKHAQDNADLACRSHGIFYKSPAYRQLSPKLEVDGVSDMWRIPAGLPRSPRTVPTVRPIKTLVLCPSSLAERKTVPDLALRQDSPQAASHPRCPPFRAAFFLVICCQTPQEQVFS